jgi:hypothetical protein
MAGNFPAADILRMLGLHSGRGLAGSDDAGRPSLVPNSHAQADLRQFRVGDEGDIQLIEATDCHDDAAHQSSSLFFGGRI